MEKFFDINEINKNLNILEKHNDPFINELTVRFIETHCTYNAYTRDESIKEEIEIYYDLERIYPVKEYSPCISIQGQIPIDVIYKSNPSGERIFLEINLSLYFDSKVVFNINGRKNIEILKSDNPQAEDEEFELTKDQLYELCKASSLKIQIRNYEGVKWEGDANGFITILQVLYNEAFDNSLFTDAHNTALSYMKTEVKKIEDKIKAGEDMFQQAKQRRQKMEQQEKQRRRKIDIFHAIILPLILVICVLFLIFGENTIAAVIATSIAASINGIYFVVRYSD